MKFTSTLALGVALAVGGVSLAGPAIAQEQAPAQPAPPARKFDISKEARKPIVELQTAVQAKDETTYPTALAAAQAAAKTNDDRYVIAQLQLRHAVDAKDSAGQLAALQAMLQSGGATPQDMVMLHSNVGNLAFAAKDYDTAAASYEKVSQIQPENVDVAVNVAKIRALQKRYPEAVAALETLIAREKAAGRLLPETNYRLALQFALDGKLVNRIPVLSRELVTAYPTPENWRIGLSLYRDAAPLDKATSLDLMRLMRASKALTGERDWYELADAANDAGLPGETKAVLDEAALAKQIDPNKPTFKDLMTTSAAKAADDRKTLPGEEKAALAAPVGRQAMAVADAYLGYGDYAKAVEFYRAAIQKGSIDANVANTRLGIALALQGQKAEAETALKAVGGSRTELANLWMLWLAQRG